MLPVLRVGCSILNTTAIDPFPHWRTKDEHGILSLWRRPESGTVLSQQELAEFTRRLSLLSIQGIEQAYQSAYGECVRTSHKPRGKWPGEDTPASGARGPQDLRFHRRRLTDILQWNWAQASCIDSRPAGGPFRWQFRLRGS